MTLVAILALGGSLAASTPNTGPKPWESDEGPLPTEVSRTMKCRVVKVEPPRTLVLLDLEAEREYVVPLPADLPIKARRKADFGGRRELEFGDLAPGQLVKMTYATADRRILRIKVVEGRGGG